MRKREEKRGTGRHRERDMEEESTKNKVANKNGTGKRMTREYR